MLTHTYVIANENNILPQTVQETELAMWSNSSFCSTEILGDFSLKEKGERKTMEIIWAS